MVLVRISFQEITVSQSSVLLSDENEAMCVFVCVEEKQTAAAGSVQPDPAGVSC